jgi:hypothetical protein
VIRLETLKSYFYEHSEEYGLKVNKNAEISVVSYAVNQEDYGAINYLISDRIGFRYVLKKSRYEFFNDIQIKRIVQLNNILCDIKYDYLRSHIIRGEMVEIFGEYYSLFKYVNYTSSYKQLRKSFLKNNMSSLLEVALEFCLQLERTAGTFVIDNNEPSKIGELFRSSYTAYKGKGTDGIMRWDEIAKEIINIGVGLVHNDLVSSNIIAQGNDYWVVDWEYWDISLSVFNFFDVMLDYGSLLACGRFAKRKNRDFLDIFDFRHSPKRSNFVKKLGKYIEKIGWSKYDAEFIYEVFLLYVMNKSVCQYRVYGSHYGSDLFWYNLLNVFLESKSPFVSFWQRMIKWRNL